MRKLSLFIATCTALVAFTALSAPAFGNHIRDPSCDSGISNPRPGRYDFNNDFAFRVFDMRYRDTMVEGELSSLTGELLVCGAALDSFFAPDSVWGCGQSNQNPIEGRQSLNERATIEVPPGVDINPTSNLPHGDYVGNARANIAYCLLGTYSLNDTGDDLDNDGIGEGVLSKTYVEANSSTDPDDGDDCPTNAVTCFRADAWGGWGWSFVWNTVRGTDGDGRPLYELTIGPMRPFLGLAVIGPTHIQKFTLCKYAGAARSDDTEPTPSNPSGPCPAANNDPNKWLQKNGRAATSSNCADGNGLYRARAKRYFGDWTAWVNKCVPWTPIVTTITSGPTRPTTTATTASFTFTSNVPGSRFECKLTGGNDSHDWRACTSSPPTDYSNLDPGSSYLFEVKATGARGDNRFGTPATWDWTIVEPVTKDPDCDGDPFNNDFRIRRFTASVEPRGEREYSELNASGLICGTAIGPYTGGIGAPGWQTLTARLDLKLAPEEIIAPLASNDPSYVPNNAYAGKISGRMGMGKATGGAYPEFQAKLKVVRPPEGDCPQDSRLVACFRAEIVEPNDEMSGYFYLWAMNGLDLGDWYRQTLMVGYLRNPDTPPAAPLIDGGLTDFNLTICRYGGTVNASDCPATPLPDVSEGWLHRNGDKCSRLTAQARNWLARITPAVETLEGVTAGPNQLCPTKAWAIIKQPRRPDWGSNRP